MDLLEELLQHIPLRALSLINAKLLGDGNLTIEGTKQPRFRFQHSYADRGWCHFCYARLSNCIPINSPKYKKNIDLRINAGFSETFYVQSKTAPVFTLLKNSWYAGKKKVVPLQLIERTLIPQALAWWYQDDGHLVWKNGSPQKIILSTDNFTLEENLSLIKILRELFHLEFSLDSQNRLCIYDQPQIRYFLYLVEDFIHFSMARKMPLYSQIAPPIKKMQRRTTIYLPFKLTTPTKEIREILSKFNPEIFINNWFTYFNKNNETAAILKYSHQVTLNELELKKIFKAQNRTGLRMSEILTILFAQKVKEAYPMDRPLNDINEEVVELPVAAGSPALT
ncbi:endonuclease [Bacillus sp. ISL-55]|nr:endonuclease [Bacillus sp. ISL-55]